jgi:FAD/FMN-containing dehydrogenase
VPRTALTSDLRRLLRGAVDERPATLAALATDFGGIVEATPRVVVRPADAADVAAVLRFAAGAGLRVVPRGAGHSQGGQSLADRGILLDLRGLDAVGEIEDGCCPVGAGATWRAVVSTTLASGMIPPVLLNHPGPTVGGTLSVGGLGRASFRHGAQSDQCAELEVVTPTGERVRCGESSEGAERELFDLVRGGGGRFGVITGARLRLRRAPRRVRIDLLLYSDFVSLLADLRAILAADAFDHLQATLLVEPRGAGGIASRPRFLLRAGTELDGDGRQSPAAIDLARAGSHLGCEVVEPAEHALGSELAAAPAAEASGTDRRWTHPWVETLLPEGAVADYLDFALRTLPPAWQRPNSLMFLTQERVRTPLLRRPAGELVIGCGFHPRRPYADRARAIVLAAALAGAAHRLGGLLYPSGLVRLDRRQRLEREGESFRRLEATRARLDPAGVLSDGDEGEPLAAAPDGD